MKMKFALILAFYIWVSPSFSQDYEIGSGCLHETNWLEWKNILVFDYGDMIGVLADSIDWDYPNLSYALIRYSCMKNRPYYWWHSTLFGSSNNRMEYYENNIGFEYIYYLSANWIVYNFDYGYPEYDFAHIRGRPVVDNGGNVHVIWQNGDSLHYDFSSDTLNSFENNIYINSNWGFKRFVSSPDNSIIGALCYGDHTLYKFTTSSSEPFNFSTTPERFPLAINPYWAYDAAFDYEGKLFLIYYRGTGNPDETCYFCIWSELHGEKILATFWPDIHGFSPHQFCFGSCEGEIILVSSYGQTFLVTLDGGDSWKSSSYGIYCENIGTPRIYNDTLYVAYYQDSYPSSHLYYRPVPRDSIIDNLTSIDNDFPSILPSNIQLSNHPNPFNAQTTISFSIDYQSQVNISIYDITGRLVEVLTSQTYDTGSHTLIWDASGQPSGIYFTRLTAGEAVSTSRMVLLK